MIEYKELWSYLWISELTPSASDFYHAVFPLTSILIPPLQELWRAKFPTHPNYYGSPTEAGDE